MRVILLSRGQTQVHDCRRDQANWDQQDRPADPENPPFDLLVHEIGRLSANPDEAQRAPR